jgi:peptidyl-prolyl cis-trans isomerase SurA
MRSSITILFVTIFAITGCKQQENSLSPDPSNPVVAEVGNERITLQDLKRHYYRSSSEENVTNEELREFLPSYINYRLKLMEGRNQGLHNDPDIQAEFKQYANELAYRYWMDDKIKKERIETFEERLREELKAFHILIELPEEASPMDTNRVYSELLQARDSLLAGVNRDSVNAQFSSTRDGNPMGGEIPWITAGFTVSDFEDALYELSTGEISMPVRSSFGYHVIQLLGRRPTSPQKQVSHIFARKRGDGNGRSLIENAYEALENDSTWADAVQDFSEDVYSLSRDGNLGWVGYGMQFPEEFVELVVAHKNDSTYSQPIETDYGFHIIRVDSVRDFSDPEVRKAFAMERLEAGNALNPDKEQVRKRIIDLEGIQTNTFNYEKVVQYLRMNEEKPVEEFELREDVQGLEIISFSDRSYTSDDYLQYLLHTVDSESVGGMAGSYLEQYRQHVIEENLVEITNRYIPGFKEEISPFLDGLIVFEVNEENIWNPDTADREKLHEYYLQNRERYRTDSTYHYTSYSFTDDSTASVHLESNSGHSSQSSELPVEASVQTGEVTVNSGDIYLLLRDLAEGEFTSIQSDGSRYQYYRLDRIEPPGIPEFEEIFNRVFTDWQPTREERFISDLKRRYGVTLYPDRIQ